MDTSLRRRHGRKSSRTSPSGLAFAFILVLLCAGCVATKIHDYVSWDGVHYLQGSPGNAVEFRADRYAIRTHDGESIDVEGEWKAEDNGRVARSCCHRFLFKQRPDGTLGDDEGGVWTRTPPTWPLQALKRLPLSIKVVDGVSGAPVSNFTYQYFLSAPAGKEYPDGVCHKRVADSNGLIVIDAPSSCRVLFEVDSLDYLCTGTGRGYYELDVTESMEPREIVVRLDRGWTINGRLVDADTGETVAGAKIAPMADCHPGEMSVAQKKTNSGDDGRFCVHGVDRWHGIEVRHEKYGIKRFLSREEDWPTDDGSHSITKDLKMKKARKLTGIVLSSDGTPVRDTVFFRGYPKFSTDSDGRFVVYYDGERITLESDRYCRTEVRIPSNSAVLNMQMKPKRRFYGRVVNRQGKPVTEYFVRYKEYFIENRVSTTGRNVKDKAGRFDLYIDSPVSNIMAVSSPGYAMTHYPFVLEKMEESAEIRMDDGAQVSGKVVFPDSRTNSVSVTLTPHVYGYPWVSDGSKSAWVIKGAKTDNSFVPLDMESLIEKGTCRVATDAKGRYVFKNVAKGSYSLCLSLDDCVPVKKSVIVREANRMLPDIVLAKYKCGTVQGTIFNPYLPCSGETTNAPDPWAFASGSIKTSYRTAVPFKADENGFYCVTNVPVGEVSVVVKYNMSPDQIYNMADSVEVKDGCVSSLDILSSDWKQKVPWKNKVPSGDVSVEVKVGDGSLQDFRKGGGFEGPPVGTNGVCQWGLVLKGGAREHDSKQPMSYQDRRFSFCGHPVATGMTASLYVSGDKTYEEVWRHERPSFDIPETNADYVLELPANSLKGNIKGESYSGTTRIYLCANRQVVREYSSWREDGEFTLRFVNKGMYDVILHNADKGWHRVENVQVDGGSQLGEVRFKSGATVRCTMGADWADASLVYDRGGGYIGIGDNDRLTLSHTQTGVTLGCFYSYRANGADIKFDHVWPGDWRLQFEMSGAIYFSKSFKVEGTNSVSIELTEKDISVKKEL